MMRFYNLRDLSFYRDIEKTISISKRLNSVVLLEVERKWERLSRF